MSAILIVAGGTGGHVFPALAVAGQLRKLGHSVSWLGTREGFETRVATAAAIPMHWMRIVGVRRKGAAGWLRLPFVLTRAVFEALGAIRRARPCVVFALGGYCAGPGAIAAFLARVPVVIHEQNAIAGLTNRWLARIATTVLSGYPGAFGARAGVRVTGNPVRELILALESGPHPVPPAQGPLKLLVFGGSQGARILNDIVPQALAGLPEARRPAVRHQCGRGQEQATRDQYTHAGVAATIVPFIEDMASAYADADLVICRAGAMTVAELTAAGVGAVLVPYPNAVDDHQTANARFLSERGAAVLVPQSEFTAHRVAELLDEFDTNRSVLVNMATASRALAVPDAAAAAAAHVLEACHA